ARRLVLEAKLDAELPPLALQDLLDQFADAIAGGGAEGERQRLALRVAAYAVAIPAPARVVEQRRRLGRVIGIVPDVGRIDPIQGRDEALGDRLAAGEELRADRLAVDAIEERLAHALIPEDGIVEIEIDMLIAEARLVEHGEGIAMALLEAQRLVEGKA